MDTTAKHIRFMIKSNPTCIYAPHSPSKTTYPWDSDQTSSPNSGPLDSASVYNANNNSGTQASYLWYHVWSTKVVPILLLGFALVCIAYLLLIRKEATFDERFSTKIPLAYYFCFCTEWVASQFFHRQILAVLNDQITGNFTPQQFEHSLRHLMALVIGNIPSRMCRYATEKTPLWLKRNV